MILDIWSMTSSHVDIRIPRTSTKGFLSLLPAHITQHEPIITNLRAAVDYTYPSEQITLPPLEQLLQMTKSETSRQNADDVHFLDEIFFMNYQSYSTVNQWLYLLESLRPELVRVVNVGKSYEGRDILGLVIKGTKPVKPENQGEENVINLPKTPAILMHGAQHAREWISVSTVCYIAYQLIAGYYSDPSVRKLVDEFEWKYNSLSYIVDL
jgi:extracellular matrix protein 14